MSYNFDINGVIVTKSNTSHPFSSLNFTGNLIPHEWYKAFVNSRGKADSDLITIFSEILYWYRSKVVTDPKTGLPKIQKKFKGDEWQTSYGYLCDKFSFDRQKVRRILRKLEERGLILRRLRNIKIRGQEYNSRLHIILNFDVLASLIESTRLTREKANKNANFVAHQKTFSRADSDDASESVKFNLPPDQKRSPYKNINNNIIIDRSIDISNFEKYKNDDFASLEETTSISSGVTHVTCVDPAPVGSYSTTATEEIDAGMETSVNRIEETGKDVSNTDEGIMSNITDMYSITDNTHNVCSGVAFPGSTEVGGDKIDTEEAKREFKTEYGVNRIIPAATGTTEAIKEINIANQANILDQTQQQRGFEATSKYKGKALSEYYPLTEGDGIALRGSSSRSFTLNYMNQLLLKLSNRNPDHRFMSKKIFMSYMSIALSKEMRDAEKVGSENFRFRETGAEADFRREQEEYLRSIEESNDVSKSSILRRKIAGIFPSSKAYMLLRNNRFDEVGSISNSGTNDTNASSITSSIYKVYLSYHKDDSELSEADKIILLREVQQVLESNIQKLEFITTNQKNSTKANIAYRPKQAVLGVQSAQMLRESLGDSNDGNNVNTTIANSAGNSIWGKILNKLINQYGIAVYNNWFSKLEAIEDKTNKTITFAAPSPFIRDYIKREYLDRIEDLLKIENYIVTCIEVGKHNTIS